MRVGCFRRSTRVLVALALGASTFAIGMGTATAAPTVSENCEAPGLFSTGSAGGLTNLLPSGSAGAVENPYACVEAGDLLDVRIGDVRATQPSVGYDQIYYKLGRYTLGRDEINKKFDDWCEANGQVEVVAASPEARLDDPASFTCAVPVGEETPESIASMKTVVVGPGGALYLTDGHHTLTSFYETPDGGPNMPLRLRVSDNLSNLGYPDFWAKMKENAWVWTQDAEGAEVNVEQLPSGIGLRNLGNDPYRSLMYFARDIGYTAGTLPFQEFYWGAWLRDSNVIGLDDFDSSDASSYLGAVEAVSRAQVALDRDALANSGRSAAELGALPAWNDGKPADKGEFGKLNRPYSDDKPGKVAYSMQYKSTLG